MVEEAVALKGMTGRPPAILLFALAGVAIVREFDAIFVPGVFIVRESWKRM